MKHFVIIDKDIFEADIRLNFDKEFSDKILRLFHESNKGVYLTK